MKKLWSIVLLIGLVNAQMPEPTMIGQDKLQVPTLSINNFVNQAEIEGLEDSRVFLGITNILEENVMDSRYELIEGGSPDFEITARVVYVGRPRKSATILGLFRRETSTTEVRVVVELINKKTGKVVSGNGTGTIDRETKEKSIQTHYFIKFDIELTDDLFNNLKSIFPLNPLDIRELIDQLLGMIFCLDRQAPVF